VCESTLESVRRSVSIRNSLVRYVHARKSVTRTIYSFPVLVRAVRRVSFVLLHTRFSKHRRIASPKEC